MATQIHILPASARKSILTATLALLTLAATNSDAQAQTEAAPATAAPAETPPAPPPAPPVPPPNPVEWKAQSKGGMLITGGNSQSKNFTFGVNGFRKEGNNKLALEGGLAYGTSNNSYVTALDSNNTIIGVDRREVVSTNNWATKGRYDRFVTEHNTGYASGQAAADKIAGKTFFGGGQIGYSRLLLKDEMNIVVAELGYDFSYERYVDQPNKTLDPVAIHSARILVGETLSLSKETGLTASFEALFNLNKEGKAINAKTGNVGVDAFKDTRINGKVGLSTNLWKSLSFGFSFAVKYDQNPAPRPVPAGAPAGTSWPKDYWSLAYSRTWDTLTEATFIYTFF
jgi:hypothetical protein